MIRPALILLAAVLLLLSLTYLFFPLSGINGGISQALASQGLVMTPEPHKSFLPGIYWDKPVISAQQGLLLELDRLSMRLRLRRLFAGRIQLDSEAVKGDGFVRLGYSPNAREAFSISADGVRLAEMPFFKTILGGTAGGLLWCQGSLSRTSKGLNGDIRIEVKQLELSGIKPGGFMLPDVSGLQVQGMIRVTEGRAHLESLTLQGDGIYMRLSGALPDRLSSPLNMVLEIMPRPEFMERQKLIFMLMTRFMVSPANFRVPIRGTMLKPDIF